MARNHGRIAVTIWQDPDFCALPVGPQRLYLFLTSQPNVSHLGVLPLTVRRWSKAVHEYSTGLLEADLYHLEQAGYVVVDEDTEEVLVRTLFRHDGVYKQPNVLLSAMSSVKAIASSTIKAALASEVEKLTLEDLEEAKRGVIRPHLATLVETLRKGSGNPSPNPNGTPSDGLGEPPTRTRARPLPISPTPSLSPEPSSKAGPRKRGTPPPDIFPITDAMKAWGRQHALLVRDPEGETRHFLDYHRAKGSLMKDWTAAWRTWMSNAQKYAVQRGEKTPEQRDPSKAWMENM